MKQGIYWIIDGAEPVASVLDKAKKALAKDAPEAVLCRFPEESEENDKKAFLNAIRPFFQEKQIAFVLQGNMNLLDGCDGVHVSFSKEISVLRKRHADISLGVSCQTRHEAMIAGEKGADYVAFEGEQANGLADWWADLFVIPCAVLTQNPSGNADFVMKML